VVWDTSRARTTAAALDSLKYRDGREPWDRRFDEFTCGRNKGWGERVEAVL